LLDVYVCAHVVSYVCTLPLLGNLFKSRLVLFWEPLLASCALRLAVMVVQSGRRPTMPGLDSTLAYIMYVHVYMVRVNNIRSMCRRILQVYILRMCILRIRTSRMLHIIINMAAVPLIISAQRNTHAGAIVHSV
jgi:hypothetical protein